MSTLRVSNIEAKADPSSPSVDEKLKVTNSNGDILVHIDGKTAGVTTIGINTTDRSFTVDAAQNVEFLGIVTATKFSLSGGGEITGGDGNFTGIVTSGSGNFTGGLSVGTAVTAATANFTSSLTAASANFTGNVSIAGTLTYEDVTNVDSVGIATARSGIDVTGGHIDLVDDSKIRVGTGDDLDLYHDATDTYLRNQTGQFLIRGNDIKLQSYLGETYATLANNNAVSLYYDNSKKLETTTTGAKVTGALEVTQEYPSIRPTLDLNFAATKSLDRRITFTRDGVGTYVDENGLVKYASNNTPRFDHDPTTRESLGLLIEESRTNYQDYSVDINTGKDFFTGSTLTSNAATSPDGTTTATRITGSGTDEGARLGWNTQSTSNTQFNVFSVFVKADSGTPILGFYSNTFVAGNVAFNIDLSDGTTNTINNPGSFYSKVVAFPNGWYRVSVMGGTGTGIGGSWNINLVPSLTSARAASSGSNASASYLIWGVQEELASAAFPTSYIPTSGSTVTRADDFATIKGTNFTDFYNQTEGTLFGEFTIKDNAYSSAAIANINQEPGSSYAHSIMFVEIGTANGYFGRTYKNSNGINLSSSSSVLNSLHPSTTPQKVSFGYTTVSGGELRAYWNGNNVNGSSDLSRVPTTLTNMRIGRGWTGSDVINAHIRKLSYYPKRLPNAQLQGLTQQ